MHARHLLTAALLIVAACFSDPPIASDESSDDADACAPGSDACACYSNGTCDAGLVCEREVCSPTDCDPGRAGCPCLLGGCDPGLACIDERCEAPSVDTGATDDGGATTGTATTTTGETTAAVDGGESSTSAATESTGAIVCGGDCSSCHACAVADGGPCDYDVTCPADGCQAMTCFMDCVDNLGGVCAHCCTNAATLLDTKLADCISEQCATTCGYECVF